MKCWICGEEATTGEHVIKASDLRGLFDVVSQKNPIYLHRDGKRNSRINTIRSNKLKSNARLCAYCNNSRTQKHDRAWETLSCYLRSQRHKKAGLYLRMNKPFPTNVNKNMLNVHLYFAKLFGCLIQDGSIPIDIEPFRRAILNEKPHPNLHIAFWYQPDLETGYTDVKTVGVDGRVDFASWLYLVMPIAVNIMYAEPDQHRCGLRGSWHPSKFVKRIQLMGEGDIIRS